MSFLNRLFGLPDTVTFTEAPAADVAGQRLEGAGTFGQVAGNLSGEVPARADGYTETDVNNTLAAHAAWLIMKREG